MKRRGFLEFLVIAPVAVNAAPVIAKPVEYQQRWFSEEVLVDEAELLAAQGWKPAGKAEAFRRMVLMQRVKP